MSDVVNSFRNQVKKFYRFGRKVWKFIPQLAARKSLDQIVEIPGFSDWKLRDYSSPLPPTLKIRALQRWGGVNTWIETGTYLGQTTLALSKFSTHVYSIEPDLHLHQKALQKFANVKNITFINGLSEDALGQILENLNVEQKLDVSFWLDGHFSAGITFKGPTDTPIEVELELISIHLHSFENFTVFVDDVRCFNPENPEYASYPSVNFLVDWARSMNLFWTIESDIFVATNRQSRPYLQPSVQFLSRHTSSNSL